MKKIRWEIHRYKIYSDVYRLTVIVNSLKYRIGFIRKPLGVHKRKSTISLADFLSPNIKYHYIKNYFVGDYLEFVSSGYINISWILGLLKNHPEQENLRALIKVCQQKMLE